MNWGITASNQSGILSAKKSGGITEPATLSQQFKRSLEDMGQSPAPEPVAPDQIRYATPTRQFIRSFE